MFKSKLLWWTLMVAWIIGCCYWHICKIKQLCDVVPGSGTLYGQTSRFFNGTSLRFLEFLDYEIDIDLSAQYVTIIFGTGLIAYFTANSYQSKTTQEIRYRLNRIEREAEFYRTRS